MILAFTGAGISRASGIPTFVEQTGLRDKLTRTFATRCASEYGQEIAHMMELCEKAVPNDAHMAIAEFGVPVITMNVDGLHQRAGSEHVCTVHGTLPDIVLYGDPAPMYQTAMDLVCRLTEGDFFLIIGTSYYTDIANRLKQLALRCGADTIEINDHAETNVRQFLQRASDSIESYDALMARSSNYGFGMPGPYCSSGNSCGWEMP